MFQFRSTRSLNIGLTPNSDKLKECKIDEQLIVQVEYGVPRNHYPLPFNRVRKKLIINVRFLPLKPRTIVLLDLKRGLPMTEPSRPLRVGPAPLSLV